MFNSCLNHKYQPLGKLGYKHEILQDKSSGFIEQNYPLTLSSKSEVVADSPTQTRGMGWEKRGAACPKYLGGETTIWTKSLGLVLHVMMVG